MKHKNFHKVEKMNFFSFIDECYPDCKKPACSVDTRYRTDPSGASNNEANQDLRLVIDADQCLDRLFGGHLTNWVADDWQKFHEFQCELLKYCTEKNIQLIYYFNGTTPENYCVDKWTSEQRDKADNVELVFKTLETDNFSNISNSLWVPPTYLKESIIDFVKLAKLDTSPDRMQVFASVNNHEQELVHFCLKNNCHSIFTNDLKVLAYVCAQNLFNIKIYSARSIKLGLGAYKLTADSYDMSKVLSCLKLTPEQFAVFSVLLEGNQLINRNFFEKFFEVRQVLNDSVRLRILGKILFSESIIFVSI